MSHTYTVVKHKILQNTNNYVEYQDEGGNGTYCLVKPEDFNTKIVPRLQGKVLLGFKFESEAFITDAFSDFFGI